MKYSLLFFAIIGLKHTQAQNTYQEHKYAIQVNNVASYEKRIWEIEYQQQHYDNLFFRKTNLIILNPTFSIRKNTKNGKFHQFELSQFSIKKEEDSRQEVKQDIPLLYADGKSKSTVDIAISFEYFMTTNFQKINKLKLLLGTGIMPYFNRANIEYFSPTSFPYSYIQKGLRGIVTPGFQYDFNKNIFLTFNLPIVIFDANLLSINSKNPSIELNERKQTNKNLKLLPNSYLLRIGMGVNL